MRRAGFGIRLAAAAIDIAALYILNVISTAIMLPLAMMRQRAGATTQQFTSVLSVAFVVTGCLWLAYASTELFGAASPAKRLLKLRIASAADHGPATLGQKGRRFALKFLPLLFYVASMAILYSMIGGPSPRAPGVALVLPQMLLIGSVLAVLGGFFATLGKDRRALHDYLGGTVVLRPGEVPQGFAPILAQPVAPVPPSGTPEQI